MNIQWFDVFGALGSVMIIGAFFLLQIEKLKSESLSYSLLNGVGALLVLISLIYSFNLAALILEVFWLGISLIGVWRYFKKRKPAAVNDIKDSH